MGGQGAGRWGESDPLGNPGPRDSLPLSDRGALANANSGATRLAKVQNPRLKSTTGSKNFVQTLCLHAFRERTHLLLAHNPVGPRGRSSAPGHQKWWFGRARLFGFRV